MKELTKEIEDKFDELFEPQQVMSMYRGSICHNMYIPESDPNSIDDVDLMGIYLAPKEYYIGLGRGDRYRKSVEGFKGRFDIVNYEFRKYILMLLKSNPNVITTLWLNQEHYFKCTMYDNFVMDILVSNRDAFRSKKSFGAFCGYANGQLKKMNAYSTEGYMGEKRKKLVDKFGYDCKNAAHCIRLLRMGLEFLNTGMYNVYRTEDRDELLDIKKGKWKLEAVKEEAEKLFDLSRKAYKTTSLPEEPNYERVENIVMMILEMYINGDFPKVMG